MPDLSKLDEKYFVDDEAYNCPFCRRRNVRYWPQRLFQFHWDENKVCYGLIIECSSCKKQSLHFSWKPIFDSAYNNYTGDMEFFPKIKDPDTEIFFSHPRSLFTIDPRIPSELRELVDEALGSLNTNFLTGASACVRKAIYEFARIEGATGEGYEDKIKSLKAKFPSADPTHFDTLSAITQMTSDKVHEDSWEKWDAAHIKILLETLRAIFHEVYVVPEERKNRNMKIEDLRQDLRRGKKAENG